MLGQLKTSKGDLIYTNIGEFKGPTLLVSIAKQIASNADIGPAKGDPVLALFVQIKSVFETMGIIILKEKIRPIEFVEDRIY